MSLKNRGLNKWLQIFLCLVIVITSLGVDAIYVQAMVQGRNEGLTVSGNDLTSVVYNKDVEPQVTVSGNEENSVSKNGVSGGNLTAGNELREEKFFKVGIDTVTRGHWEDKYGRDAAILFAYNYPGEIEGIIGKDRTLVDSNKYDLIRKALENNWFSGIKYNISGKIQCYPAEQIDENVLDMPFDIKKDKFNAYAGYGKKEGDFEIPIPAGYRRSEFVFTLTDQDIHQFSIYSSQSNKSDMYITFADKETKEILLKDVFEEGAFEKGEYASYMVSGSFLMYVDTVGDVALTGCFFDPVAENITDHLAVSSGNKSRSSRLTWTEAEDTKNVKIIIERKLDHELKWQEIARIDAGLLEYQDENLMAGSTYQYRLRTVTGTNYSLPNSVVEFTNPDYMATNLIFEKENYSAVDSKEELTVSLILKKEDGTICANQQIEVSVDFGHTRQELNTEITNMQGVATFTFCPEFMGNAVIEAKFKDNDKDMLMHSTAQAVLFVGESEWKSAPVIWKISDGILPNDLISINGYGLKAVDMNMLTVKYAPHIQDNVPTIPPDNAIVLENIQTDERDGYYVVVQLPADAKAGVYDFWVSNGYGWSEPLTLNEARPLFISEYEAWKGQNIEISGRNLDARQFGCDLHTMVRLKNGTENYQQHLAKITPYSVTFTVKDVPQGKYQVEVSNDNGITWRGLNSGQTLTIVEAGKDPLEIGVAWMDHFAWDNRFDVTDYGAAGDDMLDDTEAIYAAIEAAKASEKNGGVIYFPKGSYYTAGIKIPSNIVFLGESEKETLFIYCGEKTNMFQTAEEAQSIGHQGFANFSIRLSEDSKRPDAFFWLGEKWGISANHGPARKSSEYFLKNIDLEYSHEASADGMRGLGTVIIADERFVVQNCKFKGRQANFSTIKLNRYSYFKGNYFNYTQGYVNSSASYHFAENNRVEGMYTIIGGKISSHGIFGRQNVHMENNYVTNIGSDDNDGETYCVETPNGYINFGQIINASDHTITVIPEQGELKRVEDYTKLDYGRLAVKITGGRGMGQQKDIAAIDPDSNTITIKGTWLVNPDSTSTMTLVCPLDNVTIYNNEEHVSRKGIYLYGNIYDAVVANNRSVDTEGIYVHSAHVANNRDVASYFVSIRENILNGVSPKTQEVKIAVQSQRNIRGGSYYAVSIYGIDVRNNQLTGIRGLEHPAGSEAPRQSGLVSWSAMKSGFKNEDGYCGDNTNVIFENNMIEQCDTAITTTLGDYGFILKDNITENVGVELDNSNLDGTGNLFEISSRPSEKILSDFVQVWKNIKSEEYTQESYSNFLAALNNAVDELEIHSPQGIDIALRNLRITSGSLVRLLKELPLDGNEGNTDEDGGDDNGGDDGSGGNHGDSENNGSGGGDGEVDPDGDAGNEGEGGSGTQENNSSGEPAGSANNGTEADVPDSRILSPATGDENNIGITFMFLTSAVVLSVLVVRNMKKKNYKR